MSHSDPNRDPDDPQSALELLRARVAELERANTQLEVRETRYREMIERAREMIWVVDLKSGVTFLNSACENITGYTKEELVGKDLADLVSPENLDAARVALAQKWDNCQSTRHEIRILAKDGHPIDLEVSSTLLSRPDEPPAVLAMARDVTARRQAQEALRRSAENFEFLFANHPMPMWVFDAATLRFLEVNQAAMEKYGYSREEFLAMTAAEVRPAVDVARLRDYLDHLPRGGHGAAGHWQHKLKSGAIIDTEVFWRSVMFAGGEAILSVIQDVTGRKALEEQLQRSQKLEAVGRLAGGIAHDFNNLLTVITGYSQLLLNRIDDEHPMYAGLDQIRHSADKAAILTRQLLAFSRRQSLQPGIVEVNELAADMEKMLGRMMGEHIELVTRLDPTAGRVQADPSQIEQVILNLALNARDAMPDGGTMTLETSSIELLSFEAAAGHRPGVYAILSVTDTGSGIDSETQSHIFEPYFTTKAQSDASGLGLSAVYGMVEQHGGFVLVSSELGQGSRFEVYLPKIPEAADLSFFESVEAGGSETVLVVEDEAGVLKLIAETLRGYGYTVLEAQDATEALELARQDEPAIDLLLTDLVMPKLNGRGLADAWAILRPQAKVLFMSGYREDSPAAQMLSGLGNRLLAKPFSGVKLARKVREALDGEA